MAIRKIAMKKRPGATKPAPAAKKAAPARKTAKPTPGKTKGSSVLAGFAKSKKVAETNKKRAEARQNRPLAFRVANNESAKCILLDEKPFEISLHFWKEGDRFYEEPCITDGFCPICAKLGHTEGTFVLAFTCISLKEFTDRDGNRHKWSRMLYIVKPGSAPILERRFKANASGSYKGFRGMMLDCHRGANKKSPAIGDDIEFVKWVPEKVLVSKFGDKAVPVDYEKCWPEKSEAELRREYKVDAPAGSEEFGGDMDSTPWGSDDEDDSGLDDI